MPARTPPHEKILLDYRKRNAKPFFATLHKRGVPNEELLKLLGPARAIDASRIITYFAEHGRAIDPANLESIRIPAPNGRLAKFIDEAMKRPSEFGEKVSYGRQPIVLIEKKDFPITKMLEEYNQYLGTKKPALCNAIIKGLKLISGNDGSQFVRTVRMLRKAEKNPRYVKAKFEIQMIIELIEREMLDHLKSGLARNGVESFDGIYTIMRSTKRLEYVLTH